MMGIFSLILTGLKQELAKVDKGPPVVIRKRAILLEGDKLPLTIVSPGQESVGLETFNNVVEYQYKVNVTVVQAGNRIFEENVFEWLDLREKIRGELYKVSLIGANTVLDTIIDCSPALEMVSGAVSNYDVTGFTMTYKSIESRVL